MDYSILDEMSPSNPPLGGSGNYVEEETERFQDPERLNDATEIVFLDTVELKNSQQEWFNICK